MIALLHLFAVSVYRDSVYRDSTQEEKALVPVNSGLHSLVECVLWSGKGRYTLHENWRKRCGSNAQPIFRATAFQAASSPLGSFPNIIADNRGGSLRNWRRVKDLNLWWYYPQHVSSVPL